MMKDHLKEAMKGLKEFEEVETEEHHTQAYLYREYALLNRSMIDIWGSCRMSGILRNPGV